MNKPPKKLLEKLKLFSELSYDNVVRVSESGNYFVRLTGPTKVEFDQEFRPELITRGTYHKLLTKVPIKYETHQSMLMLTKTGKLLLGKAKPTVSSYKAGVVWKSLTIKNYRKDGYWMTIEGKERDDIRKVISKLVFMNSKSKWLLDKPFFTAEEGLFHRILYNYKSLAEMRKDLGYGFLTDKTFESLFTHIILPSTKNQDDDWDPDDQNEGSNAKYSTFIFNIILCSKAFSEKSRKNLVMVLLSIFAKHDHRQRWDVIRELCTDFENYFKRRKIDGKPFVELPNDLKSLTKTLAITNLTQDDDEEEDLPF